MLGIYSIENISLLTIQQWQLFKAVWDTHIIEVWASRAALTAVHDVLLCFLSFLPTFQYMMAGIHLDVQLYDKVCIFLKEVWQARSAWNILDCLILLLLLRKEILKAFRSCGGGRGFELLAGAGCL